MIISQLAFDLQSRLDILFTLVQPLDDEAASSSSLWLTSRIGPAEQYDLHNAD